MALHLVNGTRKGSLIDSFDLVFFLVPSRRL